MLAEVGICACKAHTEDFEIGLLSIVRVLLFSIINEVMPEILPKIVNFWIF